MSRLNGTNARARSSGTCRWLGQGGMPDAFTSQVARARDAGQIYGFGRERARMKEFTPFIGRDPSAR